ncbi:hypothetical protein B0I35DRAFT_421574 [Stachybotrys elegans]|uniref:Uncharacterized protein n=1 Tax=Stachybotrys elegans TaxID=80388 RepID=A0A8K0T101_9HYPO|nr:hypothetical protein B0I35DRAFT_421574 [Stachybotrys elegans]
MLRLPCPISAMQQHQRRRMNGVLLYFTLLYFPMRMDALLSLRCSHTHPIPTCCACQLCAPPVLMSRRSSRVCPNPQYAECDPHSSVYLSAQPQRDTHPPIAPSLSPGIRICDNK